MNVFIVIIPLLMVLIPAALFFVQKKTYRPEARYVVKKHRLPAAALSLAGVTGAHRFYLGYLGIGGIQLMGVPLLVMGLIFRGKGPGVPVIPEGPDSAALGLVCLCLAGAIILWALSDGARILAGSLLPADGSAYAGRPLPDRKPEQRLKVTYNAPLTLTYFFACLFALMLSYLTGGGSNRLLFSVHGFSFADPLSFLRLFSHVLGHQSFSHFIGNMMYLVLLGPMLEEKFGRGPLLLTVLVTAFVTGVMACLLNVGMLGASGVVFAFILMSSFTAFRQHTLPLTVILVAALYLGQQVYDMVAQGGNVAYFAHIAGGLVGAGMGYLFSSLEEKKRSKKRT